MMCPRGESQLTYTTPVALTTEFTLADRASGRSWPRVPGKSPCLQQAVWAEGGVYPVGGCA
jgi:hypothetical protein